MNLLGGIKAQIVVLLLVLLVTTRNAIRGNKQGMVSLEEIQDSENSEKTDLLFLCPLSLVFCNLLMTFFLSA